jgi:hypothetical protein
MLSMPSLDLLISEILLLAAFIIGLFTWAFSRKWFLGLVIFSILGNISFLISVESRMFYIYNIVWLKYFSLFIWPIINIFLIVLYRRKKKQA